MRESCSRTTWPSHHVRRSPVAPLQSGQPVKLPVHDVGLRFQLSIAWQRLANNTTMVSKGAGARGFEMAANLQYYAISHSHFGEGGEFHGLSE